MKLAITVDNEATKLYVDGVLTPLPNYNDWEQVDTVIIPADTRVIAVEGRDHGVSTVFPRFDNIERLFRLINVKTVSYTHLTLPTIYSV